MLSGAHIVKAFRSARCRGDRVFDMESSTSFIKNSVAIHFCQPLQSHEEGFF